MKKLSQELAYKLGSNFDIDITDLHHKNKKAVQNFFKKNKINSHVIGEVVSKKSVGKVIIKNFGKWDLI